MPRKIPYERMKRICLSSILTSHRHPFQQFFLNKMSDFFRTVLRQRNIDILNRRPILDIGGRAECVLAGSKVSLSLKKVKVSLIKSSGMTVGSEFSCSLKPKYKKFESWEVNCPEARGGH
jgi:hypothetical protein